MFKGKVEYCEETHCAIKQKWTHERYVLKQIILFKKIWPNRMNILFVYFDPANVFLRLIRLYFSFPLYFHCGFLVFFFLGFIGSNLPDYQRSEIMMFIMGKVPVLGATSQSLDTSHLGLVWIPLVWSLSRSCIKCYTEKKHSISSMNSVFRYITNRKYLIGLFHNLQ